MRAANKDHFHQQLLLYFQSSHLFIILDSPFSQKLPKHAYQDFPEPEETSINCLFCSTDSQKPKYILTTVICYKQKQKIIMFEKLFLNHFCSKMTETMNLLSKLLQINFLSTVASIHQEIAAALRIIE